MTLTTPARTHRTVLVIDATGRGHAICDLFTRTDDDVTVFYGPGCDILREDRIVSVPAISLTDPRTALAFLAENPVDFVFVSNIDALSRGYVDILRAAGHRTIGPTGDAAQLEASKERGKRFCIDNGIPTAPYRAFTEPKAAKEYIGSLPYDCVVKIDGLTPDGDGAVVCRSPAEAAEAVDRFDRQYRDDFRVVVEERLSGREVSVFALLDGHSAMLLPTALDFKRTLEKDRGTNCDGMGSIAPHPEAGPGLDQEIRTTILDRVVAGLHREGLDFTGFIYIGAMKTGTGLAVIEINARFGDSEAQVVLPAIQTRFSDLCGAILDRDLHSRSLATDGLVRCSVALTAGCLDPDDPQSLPGWPFGAFATDQYVFGLERVDRAKAKVYYANVRDDSQGAPVTCGGRVLHVVGVGTTLPRARANAYSQVGRVSFRGMRYRTDIGLLPVAVNTVDAEPLFESTESNVRSYSRSFPALFARAKDDVMFTNDGASYIDFLSGAGTLNYGHNPDSIKDDLIAYLQRDGLTHGLDLFTTAKSEFLDVFQRFVLAPRNLPYKSQFCSPSGTNAVEAALKLACLVTGRTNVISFSGGFHGVSIGSLAVTGSDYYKQGLRPLLANTTHVPYPQSPLGSFDSLDLIKRLIVDPSSGIEKPAAILLETVQGEGGVFVAPVDFLLGLRAACDEHGVLLIVDDIQAGCGRTGTFFSFERAGITPDLVTLSKSIGGYGLPMSLLLIKPEYDVWKPGQHNGTFRGNQLAFVGAAAAIRQYWADGVDGTFARDIRRKSDLVADYLRSHLPESLGAEVRGIGLMWGIDMSGSSTLSAGKVSRFCFDQGLIVEACGRDSDVLKLLPPLTVSDGNLLRGLDIITSAMRELAGDAIGLAA